MGNGFETSHGCKTLNKVALNSLREPYYLGLPTLSGKDAAIEEDVASDDAPLRSRFWNRQVGLFWFASLGLVVFVAHWN